MSEIETELWLAHVNIWRGIRVSFAEMFQYAMPTDIYSPAMTQYW